MSPPPEALAGLRVLELAEGIAGPLCARYLADFGAEVFKVEPPTGDMTRGWGPSLPGSPNAPGGLFLNLNRNKTFHQLDPSDGERLLHLIETWADLVVVDDRWLGIPPIPVAQWIERNPRLVVVAITPYGLTGPLAGAPGSDLTSLAAGGLLWLTGDPDRPPFQLPGQQALHLAGVVAAGHALVAARLAESGGPGQIVDVSVQEAVVSVLEQAIAELSYGGNIVRRNGMRHLIAHGMGRPKLADGTFVFAGNLPEPHMWDALIAFLGVESLRDPDLRDLRNRLPAADRIDAAIQDAIGSLTLDQVYRPLQARGVPITPIAGPQSVHESLQLRAREFFVDVEHPNSVITLPGPAIRLTKTPGRIRRLPHRETSDGSDRSVRSESTRYHPSSFALHSSPLGGLRVLDLTWVWSGPLATQVLAAHGADVIKIESSRRPDLGRMIGPWTSDRDHEGSGFFHLYNRGKRSVTINLRSPAGAELIRELAAVSDLVVENFSAGKMDDLGFGFDRLAERNPAVVLLSLPGLGATGPDRKLLLYGQNVEALSGMMHATGYPDRPPSKAGVIYCDPVAGYSGLFGALVALRHAERTGQGQHVDLSMLETAVSLTGETLLPYLFRGEDPGRQGNQSAHYAPHGVYQCRGEQRWVALAVRDDSEWVRLSDAIGQPDLAAHYPSVASRLAAAAAIDAAIGAWCAGRDREHVVARLRSSGLDVAPVNDPADLLADPQLIARGYLAPAEQPAAGLQPLFGPVRFTATAAHYPRPAPRLGEHTNEVLHELLGLGESRIAALRADGTLV